MKKKFFAVALAATMAVSSVMTASAETLTGTAWWTGMQVGTDYTLKGDGNLTLTVEVKEGEGPAFSVEAYKANGGNGHFFTTGSDGNGWFAEAAKEGSAMSKCPFADAGNTAAGAVTVGSTYEVTVTRKGKDFSMVYYDVTAGKQLYEIAGTSGAEFPEEINVHVMAQVGKFEVSEKKASTEDSTTKASDPTTTVQETTTEEETTTAAPAAAGKVEVTSTDAPIYDKDGKELGTVKVDIKGAEESVQKTVLSLIDSKYTDKINTKSPVLVLDITAAQFEPAEGKNVKVTYDLTNTDLKDKTDLTVYRLEADNTLKEMSNVELKDNKISFTTEHFSTYVIAQKVVKTETETTTKKDDGKGGSTGSGDAAPIVLFVAVAAVAAGVVASRKKLV